MLTIDFDYKMLNPQIKKALDDAIKLLAENITNRVMDEAQVIMRSNVSFFVKRNILASKRYS